MNVTKISVSKIVPYDKQPRKYFDEAKMGTLRNSIKKYGIKEPLTVEIQKDGTFLLVNGERRFRAAKDLGMKEVPVVIEAESNSVQRLILMFHLQEQHEGWTPIEKAIAVSELAGEMKSTIQDISKLLGIPSSTVSDYIAFGNIVDKANFQRTNVPLSYAVRINHIVQTARKVSEQAKIDFDRNVAKKIEQSIFARVRNGEITTGSPSRFFTRIKDSFVQSPKAIADFIADEEFTVDKMFSKTKAQGAYYMRNMRLNSGYLRKSMKGFAEENSIKISSALITDLKLTLRELGDFIKRYEE